jgi:hypothetical protein
MEKLEQEYWEDGYMENVNKCFTYLENSDEDDEDNEDNNSA